MHSTSLQRAKIQERKNALKRKINTWTSAQHLYMPEVSVLRARENCIQLQQDTIVEPWDVKLYLPSSLSSNVKCSAQLQDYEFKLREAQAFEALDDMRQALRLRTHMYKYKDKQVSGQSANTRCQNLIKRVQSRVEYAKTRYRTARKALLALGPRVGNASWLIRLLPLNDEDVRPLREMEPDYHKKKKKDRAKEKKKKGEGFIELSWIWKVVGVSSDENDESLQEGK